MTQQGLELAGCFDQVCCTHTCAYYVLRPFAVTPLALSGATDQTHGGSFALIPKSHQIRYKIASNGAHMPCDPEPWGGT